MEISKKIRVLVAHDTFMCREGLKSIISADNIEVLGDAIIAPIIVSESQKLNVDVIVMGLSWQDDHSAGIKVIEDIKKYIPMKWVIAIYDDKRIAPKAKEAGADIVLPTRFTRDEIIISILSSQVYSLKLVYDAFVCYSPADDRWVSSWLLPKLLTHNINACLSPHDLNAGYSIMDEMERVIVLSKKIVFIFTPDYLENEWMQYGYILLRSMDPSAKNGKLLPVILRPCRLPANIEFLTSIDFTDPKKRRDQIMRLINAIKS